MGWLLFLVSMAAIGLVVGALGRLALPGPDPMSIVQTMVIGVAASLITGLISWGIWGDEWGGLAPSVLVAMGLVYVVRRGRGGTLAIPVRPRDDSP